MNKILLLGLAGLTLAVAGCCTGKPVMAPGQPVASADHSTYVLVHGAWGGGWDWRTVADLLTADGHTVLRPTLSGQGEHSNISSTNIDLDTHIQDIVNVILWENLHDVVLVGHSYGGMVVTGVADRVPDRIKHLVYIDAMVPENGEKVYGIMPKRIPMVRKDGFVIAPWVQGNPPPPHDVPMPEGTFSEPITLTNQAAALKIPTTYILTVDPGKTPEQDDFYKFYQRAQARGWTALTMEGDHNVQRSHPHEVVKLLEAAQ
jgi:pimeloyl-ACP methyl ester carboxylesterase